MAVASSKAKGGVGTGAVVVVGAAVVEVGAAAVVGLGASATGSVTVAFVGWSPAQEGLTPDQKSGGQRYQGHQQDGDEGQQQGGVGRS